MIEKNFFEKYNGEDVFKYTLTDKISVDVLSYGGTVIAIRTPDKNGKTVDVALNFKTVKEIDEISPYMGSIIGRFGNRIGNGRFTLDGKTYSLALNDGGKAHLHGGNVGFNKKNFQSSIEGDKLVLKYHSKDGEEGYPSNLDFTVKYSVVGSEFIIEYFAESDGNTIFNPTNHTYFNLNGESDGTVLDNVMQINADKFLPIDDSLIPTGEERNVDGTPFDFRLPKEIGKDLDDEYEQFVLAGGYDHNFCLNGEHCATVYSKKTGIQMDVYTDRVGVQFYGGNFLNGEVGKSVYPKRSAFCLETQLYPDCINKPQWKSPILKKGDKFYSQTKYVFSVKE